MVQETLPEHARRAGRIRARLVFTLLGAAALVVGAFLDWMDGLAGNKVTLRSLVENDFHTRSSLLHTAGAVSVLIAIVAVVSLLDPTGWLTRLTGLAGVVLFVMFAVQVYRHDAQDFGTAVNALRPGAWLQLGGGVALLIGGMVRYRRRRGRVEPAPVPATVADDDAIAREQTPDSASAAARREREEIEPDRDRQVEPGLQDQDQDQDQRERPEPDTTVFRPPTPSEIGVGARSDGSRSGADRIEE